MDSPENTYPWSRRRFLHVGAAGVAALLAGCTAGGENDVTTRDDSIFTESSPQIVPENSNQADVIIIGAGIAGITAARDVIATGKSAIVLEATSLIGGRLRTDRSLGVAFDLGASWIHGVNGNPITTLAADAGSHTAVLDFDDVTVYDVEGKKRSHAEFKKAESAFNDLSEAVAAMDNPTKPFEEIALQIDPLWRNDRLQSFFASSYLTFDTGDTTTLSSSLFKEGEEFDGDEAIMTDGYDRIAVHLARGLDIRTNTPVHVVHTTDDAITISSGSNTFTARDVIVAVPLGVLQADAIEFIPALPQKHQQAITDIGFNAVNKFLFVWDKTFWDDTDFVVYTGTESNRFCWFANVNHLTPNAHALMTFAYADDARMTESLSDSEIIDMAMKHLRDIYGNDIPAPHALRRSTWASDPFTRGSYSYTAVTTQMNHFEDIARPVGRLHFAGEHTHREYYSTVHGAYLSGVRAASEIK